MLNSRFAADLILIYVRTIKITAVTLRYQQKNRDVQNNIYANYLDKRQNIEYD